ncbi:SCO1664 family protein [Ornithinimicrobium tianjinense]|uniref:Phosphatidylinositol kinase n=1 Tax=Ornithinimicrobium tianjinense TaxID=1195761 RepID=A0A917BL29_9MICO|nr:SCO1664 family protein [Ornithinimicrobium tianjinense]GGF47617.1 phosphatidylinositol kinase [Ornithinimicrobium tianjinense]
MPDDPVRTADGLELLRRSAIQPVGVLREASNVTVLVDLLEPDGTPTGRRAVYKPVQGERPLADFPPRTLAAREVAAYLISEIGGWGLVPPTVLRDGPLGPGSVQLWVDVHEGHRPAGGLVDVVRPEEVEDGGWLPVVEATDEDGRPLVVVHADDARLRSLAVLDAVLDNADRKAAHVGVEGDRLWGFDHGLCLNVHPKLRTVLWGWAGEDLGETETARVQRVLAALADGSSGMEELLSPSETSALRLRLERLVADPRLPLPPGDRYPLPWPLW